MLELAIAVLTIVAIVLRICVSIKTLRKRDNHDK